MTKQQALEDCIKLWRWMRDEKKKTAWEKYGNPYGIHHCPACQYTDQSGLGCAKCPIWTGVHTCLEPGSPFHMFWIGEGTPAYANRIVKLATKRLRALKRDKARRKAS
jgi:hypothetical protein